MNSLTVTFIDNNPISVDNLIASLLQNGVMITITSNDWYAELRGKTAQILSDRQHISHIATNSAEILNDIDAAATAAGVRKGVSIAVTDSTPLEGYIMRHILFLSDKDETCSYQKDVTINAIIGCLQSINVVATFERE